MNVLVACEESQTVCKAFRERGHRAFSCDLQDCSGGHPEWHIKGDVLPLINGDCTFRTADTHTHTGRRVGSADSTSTMHLSVKRRSLSVISAQGPARRGKAPQGNHGKRLFYGLLVCEMQKNLHRESDAFIRVLHAEAESGDSAL